MKNNKDRYMMAVAAILTIFRILLMARLPIWPLSSSGDDMLLVRYADSLIKGTWILENYNSSTLVKGISYSLFLAAGKFLGIPYFIGLALLYVGAAALFMLAIRPVVKKRPALYAGYLFLIYSPAGFDSDIIQRVYRMAIIPPAVVMVFALFLGLWYRKNWPVKKMLPWGVGAGAAISFFWYIREDSIWMLPFVSMAIALLVIHSFLYHRKHIWKRIVLFFLPLCIFIVSSTAYSVMNYIHYGTFLINDRTQGAFAKLSGNLLKIDPEIDENIPTAWIYKKALDEFAEISPQFRVIKDKMYEVDSWLVNGEFKGDMYQWAIRGAALDLGYYSDSQAVDQLYTQLNSELEQAFKEGKLSKKDAVYFSSQSKGIEYEELPALLRDCISNTYSLLTYEYMSMEVEKFRINVMENEKQIRLMEAVTNSLAVHLPTYEYRVRGTIKAKNKDDILQLYMVDNELGEEIVEVEIAGGTFFANCFDYGRDNSNSYSLNLYVNGLFEDNLAAEDVIDNSVYSFEAFDSMVRHLDYAQEYVENTQRVSNFIIEIYRKTAVPLIVLASIAFCILAANTLKEMKEKRYEYWNVFLPVLGMTGTLFILIFGTTLFTQWLTALDGGNRRFVFYAVGAIPMIQILEYLSLYFGGKCIWCFIRKRVMHM